MWELTIKKLTIIMIIFFYGIAHPLLAVDVHSQEDIILQQLDNLNLTDLQKEIQKINEEIENYPTLFSGTEPGDVKYMDLNEDGRISADDMVYLGRTFYKYNFGANLNFAYKGFDLSMLFQGAAGAKTRLGGAIIEMGI